MRMYVDVCLPTIVTTSVLSKFQFWTKPPFLILLPIHPVKYNLCRQFFLLLSVGLVFGQKLDTHSGPMQVGFVQLICWYITTTRSQKDKSKREVKTRSQNKKPKREVKTRSQNENLKHSVCLQWNKGSFNNYVDQNIPNFDSPWGLST